jgi:glycine oxidase
MNRGGLWPAASFLPLLNPELRTLNPLLDDCLIIGGGVIGLSIAYELSTHGLRVRVLDRQQSGREASWAGAGILPPALRSPPADQPLAQLAALSMKLHPQWAEALQAHTGIDNEFRQCGGWALGVAGYTDFSPSASPQDFARAMYAEPFVESEGFPYAHVSLQELVDREPALAEARRNGKIIAAAFAEDEAQLRNPRHLQALSAACQKQGVMIEAGVEATGFWSSAGQVVGAQTSAGPKYAGSFCITSGAWSGRVADTIGLRIAVKPIRGQMVLFERPQPVLHHIINVGRRYLVPRLDGRVLVGSTEEDVGFDKNTTSAGINGLLEFAHALIPAWQSAKIEKTWAGLRPATADELPYLAQAPQYRNLFVAAGHFRTGLYLSTGTAVVMSQLIRGERPVIDLSAFRIDR